MRFRHPLLALAMAIAAGGCTGSKSAEKPADDLAQAPAADPIDAGPGGDPVAQAPMDIEVPQPAEPVTAATAPTLALQNDDAEASPVDPANPQILRRPYSADEIRAEWTVGFEMKIRTWADGLGEQVRIWRVVDADADGAVLELTQLDESGAPKGPRGKEHFTWVQLRDNVTFPVGQATVESVSADTPLGKLDCWRYLMWDEARGTVAEFLFAKQMPGLPITIDVRQDGELVATTAQLARSHP